SGTGTKAGEDVAAVRRVEIAPAVGNEPLRRGEASATQHLVGSEPGLGVLVVGIAHESGIGREGGGGPLPDVADHLPAPAEAVSGSEAGDRHAAAGPQVRPAGIARVAPRILAPAALGERGGDLPLSLRGQAPTGVAAIRAGFVPVDVHHRQLVLAGHPSREATLEPLPVALDPVARRLRLALAFPAFGRPPLAAPVSTVEHELEELPVRDRRLRDLERRELHRVRPLLVVEMESGAALGADLVRPAGNFRLALEPVSIRRGLPAQRIRVPERLPGVVEPLSMHILVQARKLPDVGEPGIFGLALQTSQYALQNPAAVFQ